MNETKGVFASRTVWAGIVAVAAALPTSAYGRTWPDGVRDLAAKLEAL